MAQEDKSSGCRRASMEHCTKEHAIATKIINLLCSSKHERIITITTIVRLPRSNVATGWAWGDSVSAVYVMDTDVTIVKRFLFAM